MAKLSNIIQYESDINKERLELADQVGVSITTMEECIEAGKANTEWQPAEVTCDDTCMFSYTSGTTGDPKGVKLTHKMLVQCAAVVNCRLRQSNN